MNIYSTYSIVSHESSFLIEAIEINEKKVSKRTSIPVDGIYSSRHYTPDRLGARMHIHQRRCILAFTLNTARKHWSKSSYNTYHLYLLNPSCHLLCRIDRHIFTPQHSPQCRSMFAFLCMVLCLHMYKCTVFDPDRN